MKASERRYQVVMEMNQGSVCVTADSFREAEALACRLTGKRDVWAVIKMEEKCSNGTTNGAVATARD